MNDTRTRIVADMLEKAETMGLFPAAAIKIRSVSSDPVATLDDMERAVSLDAALGAQILKLANSPFYGLPRKVATIHQAIFVLGFSAIQQLALSLALMSMGRKEHAWSHRMWEHAKLTANASSLIARCVGRVQPQEAFVGGMLHDLGEMLLLHIYGSTYEEVLGGHEHLDAARHFEEERLFGCDHASLGGACLTEWLLPAPLCHAVSHHHDAESIIAFAEDDRPTLGHVVYLGDRLADGIVKGTDPAALCAALAQDPVVIAAGLSQAALLGVLTELGRE